MIQVKEFLNYQEGQETEMNKWLQEKSEVIEIVDIKYSVGTFQATGGYDCSAYSGSLIVYKTK